MLFPMKSQMNLDTDHFLSSGFLAVSQDCKTYSAVKICGGQNCACWVSLPSHSVVLPPPPPPVWDSSPRVLVCTIGVAAVPPVTQERARREQLHSSSLHLLPLPSPPLFPLRPDGTADLFSPLSAPRYNVTCHHSTSGGAPQLAAPCCASVSREEGGSLR